MACDASALLASSTRPANDLSNALRLRNSQSHATTRSRRWRDRANAIALDLAAAPRSAGVPRTSASDAACARRSADATAPTAESVAERSPESPKESEAAVGGGSRRTRRPAAVRTPRPTFLSSLPKSAAVFRARPVSTSLKSSSASEEPRWYPPRPGCFRSSPDVFQAPSSAATRFLSAILAFFAAAIGPRPCAPRRPGEGSEASPPHPPATRAGTVSG